MDTDYIRETSLDKVFSKGEAYSIGDKFSIGIHKVIVREVFKDKLSGLIVVQVDLLRVGDDIEPLWLRANKLLKFLEDYETSKIEKCIKKLGG